MTSGDLVELATRSGWGRCLAAVAARLAAHTEGNALYCRALLDEIGVAGLSAGIHGGLPAPRELSAVILARVGALPGPTQSLLAAAAVLGQHAPMSTVMALAELPDARHEVDAAVAAGLVTEGVASELTFVHPLYRAAIYGDLSPTRRRALHARAAELVAGRARLVHRVAASLGPDDALATELEGGADLRPPPVTPAPRRGRWNRLPRCRSTRPTASVDCSTPPSSCSMQQIHQRPHGSWRCQVSSARRDALTGLLGVFTGSPTAESRLLAAWRTHDRQTETEIGARAATSLANWMAISGRPDRH